MKENSKNQQKCKNCGGNLVFSPKEQDLVCEKCSSHQSITHIDKIQTHSLRDAIVNKSQTESLAKTTNRFVKCPNCGSKIELNEFEVSKDCDYCGSSIVAQEAGIVVEKPDGIIPFMFDNEVVAQKFVAGVKNNFWAPHKFKKKTPPLDSIQGDYIPSFGFNADTVYTYKGRLYNNVTVRDRDGHSRTERRYFSISGADSKRYENILVESSSKLSQDKINGVLPYRYNNSKKYNDAYIAGYVVEQYDTTVDNCLQTYKLLLDQKIRNDILSKYRYDGVDSLHVTKTVSNETYSYFLVPVYKITYSYKNKPYITYMNGQTGRIDTNIPKSGLKIAMSVILPILFVAIFIILSLVFGQ